MIALKEIMLIKAMEEFGIPEKLICLTRATLKTVKFKVNVQNDISESPERQLFATERQFSMYNIALVKVMRDRQFKKKGALFIISRHSYWLILMTLISGLDSELC
jgi:hypothetical protein